MHLKVYQECLAMRTMKLINSHINQHFIMKLMDVLSVKFVLI